MPIEVKIPAVGESITSGVVSVWHKKSGEFVNEGEPLFTLETDKVSTEIVAEKDPEPNKVEKPQEKKKEESEGKKKEAQPEKKPAVAAGADRGGPESPPPATTLSPAVRRIVEEEKLEPEKI